MDSIRLNKFISSSGYCSRREVDKHIENGHVTINGRVAQMGDKVTGTEIIKINGQQIEGKTDFVYLALNKPVGVTSTTDPKDPTNIVDFVNYPERIFHIGRLDKDSEGLIFLTNNGDIVNKILRAGNNHEKEYIVTVDKPIDQHFVERMAGGVPILGTMTKKCKVTKEGGKRFRIILTQGLNRQIRRMCEALGYEVKKLQRIRIMNITLDGLKIGQWRLLRNDEIKKIMSSVAQSDGGEKASQGAGAGNTRKSTNSPSRQHKTSQPRGQRPTHSGHQPQRSAHSNGKPSTRNGRGGRK